MKDPNPTIPPDAGRSWWLREALAHDPGEACPPLSGSTTADVVILGGGYTGMWTAYFLKEREPELDVVLLEQDICGGGPSGRNGGFVNGWWGAISSLADRFGDSDAMELAMAASRSIEGIGRFCERHGIDAWFTYAGELHVATNRTHEAGLAALVEGATRFGVADEFVRLDPEALHARCDSGAFVAGVFARDVATVQPARLARGLRRVLLERGVRIFEGTPVGRFGDGDPVVAETPGGSVRAGRAVLAVGP